MPVATITRRDLTVRVTAHDPIREVLYRDPVPLERRRTAARDLYQLMTEQGYSFWHVVYPFYMNREITKGDVREVVHLGLTEVRGNYRQIMVLFNMNDHDYKRFLNFLRKHECQLPFQPYRQARRTPHFSRGAYQRRDQRSDGDR